MQTTREDLSRRLNSAGRKQVKPLMAPLCAWPRSKRAGEIACDGAQMPVMAAWHIFSVLGQQQALPHQPGILHAHQVCGIRHPKLGCCEQEAAGVEIVPLT